jgi:transposase-like protein
LPRFRGDAEEQTPLPPGIPGGSSSAGPELGPAIAQIALELGIAHGTLSAWVKQAELDAGLRSDGLVTAEREELRRLHQELKRVNGTPPAAWRRGWRRR